MAILIIISMNLFSFPLSENMDFIIGTNDNTLTISPTFTAFAEKNHHLNIPNNYNNPGNVNDKTSSLVIKGQGLIIGTNEDNYIVGSELDDTIYGKNGNDVIVAIGGDDSVYAGKGDDTVYGGDGNNQLFGEDGEDNIIGGPFNDLLVGGKGDDHINSSTGDDIMIGGSGADYFECGSGLNTVVDFNPTNGDLVSNGCVIVNNIGNQ
jgi:Ca2+-binding RTX toxin-like protein